jgi:hypothetical protein
VRAGREFVWYHCAVPHPLVRTLSLAALLLSPLACHSKDSPEPAKPEPSEPEPIVEPDPGKPVAPGSIITLDPFATEVRAPLGAELRWSFKSHGSVGYAASHAIGDEQVVAYRKTDMTYEYPDKVAAGMPGGDAATGTFVFEAVGVGTTTLRVDNEFRGTVEQSTTYTITVEAPAP